MKPRYILSPEAASDLFEIWQYVRDQSSVETADRVESVIREKFLLLAKTPHAGHVRNDLTDRDVRFFPVYSYLIVYRSEPKPVQIVAILDGHRDIKKALDR